MQPSSPNRHYLPEWLLHKFRVPTLHELDIMTGGTTQRSPAKAASAPDLWPDDIENRLSIHDNKAARIYRNRIVGQRRIQLTEAEKLDFSLWLAHFFTRIPAAVESARTFLGDRQAINELTTKIISSTRRREILDLIRTQNPSLFDSAIAALGKEAVENHFIGLVLERFGAFSPDPFVVRQHYMRYSRSDKFARLLTQYHWVWLHSPGGFVIGDNPLVRWHGVSQKWDFGINRKGVEITMPLGHSLCLLLQRAQPPRGGYLVHCNERKTRILNCRQRLSAHKNVYAASSELLDFIAKPIVGWTPKRLSM